MTMQTQIAKLLHEGAAAQRGGDLGKAERLYRQVLKLDRKNADAHHLLGIALHQKGQSRQGAKSLEAAVAAQPDNAGFRRSLAQVLIALGEDKKARLQLEKAVALDPNFVAAQANLGELLGKAGEHALAATHLKAALRHVPNHPGVNNNLGNSLLKLKRFEEAAAAFQNALRGDPSLASAWEGLGDVLIELDRGEEAMRLLDDAVARFPENPRLLTKYGGILQQFGKVEKGEALLRRALELDRRTYPAMVRLANFHRFREGDPLLTDLRALWEEGGAKGEDYHSLAFALGKAEADCGNHEAAFARYAEGNRLRRAEYGYDRQEARAANEALMRRYDSALFESKKGYGVADPRPVLVVGMPRSGTTLTERILAAHPAISGVGEARALSLAEKAAPEDPARLGPEDARRLGAAYLDAIAARAEAGSLRIVDKMPHNFQRLGLAALLLPGARVIHCRRDPADTCLSIFFQSFGGYLPFAYDLEDLGWAYQDYRRLMAHWKRALPLPLLDLDYEALVEDTEGEARRLLDFLEIEWDPAVLRHHEAAGEVKTASQWQVRQPVYQSSRGRWRRYETQLAPLLPFLEDLEDA